MPAPASTLLPVCLQAGRRGSGQPGLANGMATMTGCTVGM
jgi:hypothetical protein